MLQWVPLVSLVLSSPPIRAIGPHNVQTVHQRSRRGKRYRIPRLPKRGYTNWGERGTEQSCGRRIFRECYVPPPTPGAPSSLPFALVRSVSGKRKSKYTSTFGARFYLDYEHGFAGATVFDYYLNPWNDLRTALDTTLSRVLLVRSR